MATVFGLDPYVVYDRDWYVMVAPGVYLKEDEEVWVLGASKERVLHVAGAPTRIPLAHSRDPEFPVVGSSCRLVSAITIQETKVIKDNTIYLDERPPYSVATFKVNGVEVYPSTHPAPLTTNKVVIPTLVDGTEVVADYILADAYMHDGLDAVILSAGSTYLTYRADVPIGSVDNLYRWQGSAVGQNDPLPVTLSNLETPMTLTTYREQPLVYTADVEVLSGGITLRGRETAHTSKLGRQWLVVPVDDAISLQLVSNGTVLWHGGYLVNSPSVDNGCYVGKPTEASYISDVPYAQTATSLELVANKPYYISSPALTINESIAIQATAQGESGDFTVPYGGNWPRAQVTYSGGTKLLFPQMYQAGEAWYIIDDPAIVPPVTVSVTLGTLTKELVVTRESAVLKESIVWVDVLSKESTHEVVCRYLNFDGSSIPTTSQASTPCTLTVVGGKFISTGTDTLEGTTGVTYTVNGGSYIYAKIGSNESRRFNLPSTSTESLFDALGSL